PTYLASYLFLSPHGDHRDLHSFPTRRSSDLFNTGDLAYRDSKGFYYLVGRDRDQVISGGYKIASAEVEEQILKHESVAQAAVVGDRKSTRLNSSHVKISYAVFCLKKKK